MINMAIILNSSIDEDNVQEVLDMLDEALDKKRLNREAIENVRDMLVRLT